MSAIKCIVINGNGNPITNEDGTAYIYDSIKEARAEIRANGYSYNRANDRYYFKAEDGTEYRAYILREGTPDYDYAIEKTAQNAAPEYISPEAIQTVAGQTIYKSVDPITNELVYTVSGRDFWTVAEARYFAQCNPVNDIDPEDLAAVETSAETAAAFEDDNRQPYQRYELEAYLGDHIGAYDVEAIEAEATEAGYWTASGEDLARICERHDISTKLPTILDQYLETTGQYSHVMSKAHLLNEAEHLIYQCDQDGSAAHDAHPMQKKALKRYAEMLKSEGIKPARDF